MKCSVNQDLLLASVKAVNKCLSRRPHLPILGGIHLKADDGKLELTTTDMTAGLRVKIPAEITQAGETTVSGKNFVEAVTFFDKEGTDLELMDKQVLVKNGRDLVKIPILTEDFPLFDDKTDDAETVSKEVSFWEFISKNVSYAASRDQSRPALTGVLIKANAEKMNVVGTDGYRVAIWETKETLAGGKELEIIVNAKAISDVVTIAGILDEEKVGFYHHTDGEQVIFTGENFSFFSKLINAKFPPFEKIVPLEFTTQATIDRETFTKNLAKAGVFTRTDSNSVKMHLEEAQISYTATSLGDGSFQGSQEVLKFTGAPLDIAFKINFLQEYLSTCSGETVELNCNGELSPMVIKDPDNSEMLCVIMPFRPKK